MRRCNNDKYTKAEILKGTLEKKLASLEKIIVQRSFKILVVLNNPLELKQHVRMLEKTLRHAQIVATADIEYATQQVQNDFNLILSSYRFEKGNVDGHGLFQSLKENTMKSEFRVIQDYAESEVINLHKAGIITLNYPPTLDNCRTSVLAVYLKWLSDWAKNE